MVVALGTLKGTVPPPRTPACHRGLRVGQPVLRSAGARGRWFELVTAQV